MYSTTEVRWFFSGTIPPHVEGWFQHAGHDPTEGKRTDHYLSMPDVDAIGVKWREGHLEVKHRVADLGEALLADDAAGAVGRWHKWRFDLSQADVLATLRAASDWIAVTKDRRLHTYAVDDEGRIHNVAPEILPRSGCELELSTVRAAGETWWTVAFEAFGHEDAQLRALRHTVDHVLHKKDAPIFPATASASYPRWLGCFLTEKG